MKKSNKTILIIFGLFALDFISTWYHLNNSDYASEGNPMIDVDGGYLILVINIIYFGIIFFLMRIVSNYKTIALESNSVWDYSKKLYKSEKVNFIFTSFAFSFVYATIVSRCIVVIDWIVFGFYDKDFYLTSYYKVRNLMPFGRYDIFLGILAVFIFLLVWYKVEYKKSKKMIKEIEDDEAIKLL